MGYTTALGLAESGMDLVSALRYHLTANHYPPVPASMIQPCIEAICAYEEEDTNREIDLSGNLWRGQNTAPAWAIIDGHHLEPFVMYCEEADPDIEY